MLYPSETSRKPLEAILVRLKGIHRGFVRPEFASVFGSWSFWSFGTLLRARAVVGGHCGVSRTSQQDTPQRAVVDGSKGANCRCPLSLIIAYLLGEEMGFV
jgi:hypothetical protein